MTRESVKRIISDEGLTGYRFFESGMNGEHEIVIVKDSRQWIVYATDERACKVTGSDQTFDNEEDALDNFVKRLRALNALIRLKA